jgi:hypothetical protein
VLGFGLAIWQAMRAEQLNKRQRDLDWPRFRNAASDLARSVDRSGFMPDLILSISDRGAMVGHLVARELLEYMASRKMISKAAPWSPPKFLWRIRRDRTSSQEKQGISISSSHGAAPNSRASAPPAVGQARVTPRFPVRCAAARRPRPIPYLWPAWPGRS